MKEIKPGDLFLVADFESGARPVLVIERHDNRRAWRCKDTDGAIYDFDAYDLLVPAEEEDILEVLEGLGDEIREDMKCCETWNDFLDSPTFDHFDQLISGLRLNGFYLSFQRAERVLEDLYFEVRGGSGA